MPLDEYLRFAASDGARLTGKVYESDRPSKGTVILLGGHSAKIEDMEGFTILLAKAHRVIAINLRGHGGKEGFGRSEGFVQADRCIKDCIELNEEYGKGNSAFIGHSFGSVVMAAAGKTDTKAVVLINPFVHTSYLPRHIGRSISFLYSNRKRGWLRNLDSYLNTKDMAAHGFNMDDIFRNTAGLKTFDLRDAGMTKTPLLYFVADNDRALGTQDEARLMAYRFVIATASEHREDASRLVKGLNHCLNYHGYTPFLKDEPGKEKQRILNRIGHFLEKHL